MIQKLAQIASVAAVLTLSSMSAAQDGEDSSPTPDFWEMPIEELRTLADGGDASAALSLAQRLEWTDEDGAQDAARAYAKAAMDAGLPGGKSVYARYLARGVGGPVDGPGAVILYEQLVEADVEASRSELADMLDGTVEGVEPDLPRAFDLYFEDAQNGSAFGAVSLANWYENGIYFKKDVMAAADWYEHSAELGWEWNYYTAAYLVQENIDESRGRHQRAIELMEKAVEVDESAAALNNLGVLHSEGYRSSTVTNLRFGDNPGVAFGLFTQCFEKYEDAYCAYNLGAMYADGRGTRQNTVLARKYYQIALDSGDPALADAAQVMRDL